MKEVNILSKMAEYAINNNLSYYELGAYAYQQDKEDWILLLNNKKGRQFLSIYLRNARKTNKIKYQKTLAEAMEAYSDAKLTYHQRHENEWYYHNNKVATKK